MTLHSRLGVKVLLATKLFSFIVSSGKIVAKKANRLSLIPLKEVYSMRLEYSSLLFSNDEFEVIVSYTHNSNPLAKISVGVV